MGSCQATTRAEIEVRNPLAMQNDEFSKKVAMEIFRGAPDEPKPVHERRKKKNKPKEEKEEVDDRGVKFDRWFPVLAKTLGTLAATTNYEAVRRSLKYASEDFYNWTTREFLTAAM